MTLAIIAKNAAGSIISKTVSFDINGAPTVSSPTTIFSDNNNADYYELLQASNLSTKRRWMEVLTFESGESEPKTFSNALYTNYLSVSTQSIFVIDTFVANIAVKGIPIFNSNKITDFYQLDFMIYKGAALPTNAARLKALPLFRTEPNPDYQVDLLQEINFGSEIALQDGYRIAMQLNMRPGYGAANGYGLLGASDRVSIIATGYQQLLSDT